jgi:hypothetical protein
MLIEQFEPKGMNQTRPRNPSPRHCEKNEVVFR